MGKMGKMEEMKEYRIIFEGGGLHYLRALNILDLWERLTRQHWGEDLDTVVTVEVVIETDRFGGVIG